MARIYVSSTFKDLEECREKVRLSLRQMGHEDIAMEYYVAGDERPVDKCLEDVASCDLYIGIFAWRYGFVPKGYDKSITELEYRKAVETGKHCLIFLLHENAPWPRNLIDKGEDQEKIEALRNELSAEKTVSFFNTPDELASVVGSAVHNWEINNRNPVRNPVREPFHIAPIQVPSLTESFVELPVMQEIKSHLLNGSNSQGILAITAIQGLGGIGKTTLAKIVAHDKEVQSYFSNGILWVTLGQEPDKLSLLNGWIKELGDSQSNHTTVETASNHLITLLYEKHILLVVDDAWNSRDVKPFLVGGSSCQTIITTRKAYIADDLGAKCYSLNLMTEEQSLELFAKVLQDSWKENEKEHALKVAKDVGYLPLALNLAAKRRKRDYPWVKIHEALEEEIALLSVLSPRVLGKREEGLEASLNLSLKALRSYDEEAFLNFIWLGVLPDDIKVNEKMASTLWGIDKEEAGYVLEFLWEEGLLTQDSIIQLGNEKLKTYRIHDLFHDIACHYLTRSPNTENSTELPGLGLTLNEAHTSLLNRYQSKMQKVGLWHTLEDDAYIHSHLTWHMEKAGKIEDIHNLLIEETENGKNGWYEALESLELNAVFIEDLMKAWNLSEKNSEHQIEQGNKTSFIGLELRYALIYTSINSLSSNISTELLVALLETKKWNETKVFIYAQKEPDSYERVTKLISIYRIINDESMKEEVMDKALEITSRIQYDYARSNALSALVPHLDGQRKEEVIEKALEIASKIQNDYYRLNALSVLVPHLDGQRKEEVMDKALEITSRIQDDYHRSNALSALIPHLDGQRKEEVMDKALEIASRIQFDYARSNALSALIPHLDSQRKEEVIEKALEIASKSQNDYYRSNALLALVPHLDGQREEVIEKALEIASKIQDDYHRSNTLFALVPYLDGQRKEEVIEKALEITSRIQDNYYRARALSTLVPHLDGQRKEEVIEKALEIASKIQNDYYRSNVLSALVPHLDGQRKEEVMDKALEITSRIQDDYHRSNVLSALVPHLDGQRKEEVMEKALEITSRIQDDYHRSNALSALVPHLDGQRKEEVMDKALEITSRIQDDYHRSNALSALVPHLDGQRKEEVIEKALEITSRIQDDYYRLNALSVLVPHLDGQRKEEVMDKALEITSRIQDDYHRSNALSALIPHLDVQRKEEVIEKALEIASKIQDDTLRADALSVLVPHLDVQRKEEVIEKALEIASKIQDDILRADALSVLVPHLDSQRKEEAMEKALEIASKIQLDYVGVDVLCFALSSMRNSPSNKLYFLWRKGIRILREYPRSNLLSNIITLIPVMNDLGEDETLFEISRAIIDVSNWFP
ncbi:NB-ARC domain-containing protein [Methanosarcina vacuolata]|nr:NB-ARC domain-containing protein [Methanosarcina vacuolata]